MDPSLTIADALVGNIIGLPDQLPDVFCELKINYYLLRRLVGVKTVSTGETNKKINKITKGEVLLVNVGSTSSGGRVLSTVTTSEISTVKIALYTPVCTSVGEKIALSRKISRNWRLIGWGTITGGRKIYGKEIDQ